MKFSLDSLAVLIVFLLGLVIFLTSELPGRDGGGTPIPEIWSNIIGCGIMLLSVRMFIPLCSNSGSRELSKKGVRKLEGFQIEISGLESSLRIKRDGYSIPGSAGASPCFWYILEARFTKSLPIKMEFRRRDKLGCILWYLGVARIGDTLTGVRYFDSRFSVKSDDKEQVKRLRGNGTIKKIQDLDKRISSIGRKRGKLSITNCGIKYWEGPYDDSRRILDSQRGIVEGILADLVYVAKVIESGNN